MYRYKLRGNLQRINFGRYPFIDCLQAFNTYYAAWTQVIGGVDVALQMAKQKVRELKVVISSLTWITKGRLWESG